MRKFKNYFGLGIVLLSLSTLVSCSSISRGNQEPWLKPGLLTSSRVEMKFGSFGVEVLAQDQSHRVANLFSTHDGKKITRILAYTQYEAGMDSRLLDAHKAIVAGGSIGSTLQQHGFDLKKSLFFKGHVGAMPQQVHKLMPSNETTYATIIYNLSADWHGTQFPYCTIAEVYAPEYLNKGEFDELYPETKLVSTDRAQNILEQMRTWIRTL